MSTPGMIDIGLYIFLAFCGIVFIIAEIYEMITGQELTKGEILAIIIIILILIVVLLTLPLDCPCVAVRMLREMLMVKIV